MAHGIYSTQSILERMMDRKLWDRSRILSSCLFNDLILWYPTASNAILRSGFPSSARGIIEPQRHYPRANACHADSAASANRTALLEDRPATATHVEKFLHRIHDPLARLLHGAQKPEALAEEGKKGGTYHARLRGPLLRLEEDRFRLVAAGAFLVRSR